MDKLLAITLAEFLGQYQSTHGQSYRAATRKTYENTFNQLYTFVSEGILLRQITPAMASATLKALMGHASITTTEKYYLQKSDENTRAAVRRYEKLLQEKP